MNLSRTEQQLIEAYRAMTPDQRELIHRAMDIEPTAQLPPAEQDDRNILRRYRKEHRF